jgi:iron complex outermembrane receptor protein
LLAGLVIGFPSARTLAAGLIDEVVVTAQKREQDAQDIGISVSAFSGEQLKALGVADAADLADMTSGVSINMEYGTAPTFTIRGVSVNDFAATTPPAAAVYLDGVYKASNVNSGVQLFDVERIEILKGPQGTLWGRNTTGGAVSVTSVRPSQEANGYVNVGLGSHGATVIEGAYGAGLTDTLSTRFSVRKMDSDGPYKSTIHGDAGGLNSLAARAQFLLETDIFTGNLQIHYAQDKGRIEPTVAWLFGSCAAEAGIVVLSTGVPYAGNPEDASCGNPDRNDDTVENDWNGKRDNQFYGATLNMDFDISDNMAIKSVTAFDHFERNDGLDFDGSSAIVGRQIYQQRFNQVSQEVRLEVNTDNGFWLLGGYFDSSEMKDPAQLTPLDVTYGDLNGVEMPFVGGPWDPSLGGSSSWFGGIGFDIENVLNTSTRAIFGHFEHGFTDKLTLIAGLRYEDENKTGTHSEWAGFPGSPIDRATGAALGGTDGGELQYSMSALSYKLGLNLLASDDLLLYGYYASGVKAGGLDNAFGGFNNSPFKEETLKALEIGFKWDPADNLRFNGSLYSYDYDDMQQRFSIYVTNQFGDEVGAEQLGNIANAKILGADFELTYAPTDALEMLFTLTWLDTEVNDSEATAGFVDQNGNGTFEEGIDINAPIDGNKLPFSPDLSATALIRHTSDWNNGYSLTVQASANHTSDHFISIENVPFEEQSYTKIGAFVGLTSPDDKWTLSLTGRNLTDEIYAINGFPSALGGRGYFINTPRSWMLQFQYNL